MTTDECLHCGSILEKGDITRCTNCNRVHIRTTEGDNIGVLEKEEGDTHGIVTFKKPLDCTICEDNSGTELYLVKGKEHGPWQFACKTCRDKVDLMEGM